MRVTKAHFMQHVWEMLDRPGHYIQFKYDNKEMLEQLYKYERYSSIISKEAKKWHHGTVA